MPDYALGPHTGSLGLSSSDGNTLPARFRQASSSVSMARGIAGRGLLVADDVGNVVWRVSAAAGVR